MPKYLVTWHVDATGSHEVEADSEEEARRISTDEFYAGSENTEICDAQEIVGCRRLE